MRKLNRIENLYFLAADTARARAYYFLMRKNGFSPSRTILLDLGEAPSPSHSPIQTILFDNLTPLRAVLDGDGEYYEAFPTHDANSLEVTAALTALPPGVVIFAPAAGLIARAQLFNSGHEFLHVHPGRLPDYRGSTPMYYSLLCEKQLCATALLLSPGIDEGAIISQKIFSIPSNIKDLDYAYDPFIRASLLCEVIEKYSREKELRTKPQVGSGMTYHVIHPVLKHLALLGNTP